MAEEPAASRRYRISGLLVASELRLQGLIEAPERAVPDVTIRRHTVPAALADATDKGSTWEIGDGRFLLRIDGTARFLLTDGREIAFEMNGDASLDDVAIFLTGSVFGILLHQRRQVVLHASAVRVGHKAVLFCGPSGAGKSTLAAALVRCGYPLLSDDVCALSSAGDVPAVHPDGRKLKLWAEAIDELGLASRRGSAVRATLGKFYVEPEGAVTEPSPVGAVYELHEAQPPGCSGIARTNVVGAAQLVRQNAYRPPLVDLMGQTMDYFKAGTAIANAGGIFCLARPLDYAAMPTVVAWLEQHWREIGLLDTAR